MVISALARGRAWRRALQLLDVMDDLEIPKTVVTYNTVISACARAGEVGTAKNLLAKMRKQGVPPNVISFNSVMAACASTSRWKDALSLLDQCHREPGVQPDIITYTNAMRACAKGRQTNRALALLQVVKDRKLAIDNYCYTAVIDGKIYCARVALLMILRVHFSCFCSRQRAPRPKCGGRLWTCWMRWSAMVSCPMKSRTGKLLMNTCVSSEHSMAITNFMWPSYYLKVLQSMPVGMVANGRGHWRFSTR